ncbi:hypothetical protein D3C81_2063620 [compost metagenome]
MAREGVIEQAVDIPVVEIGFDRQGAVVEAGDLIDLGTELVIVGAGHGPTRESIGVVVETAVVILDIAAVGHLDLAAVGERDVAIPDLGLGHVHACVRCGNCHQ